MFPTLDLGSNPRSPALQVDSLPAEPQWKQKSTGVCSLLPSPGDHPDPGIELGYPALQTDSLPTELPGKPHWPNILSNLSPPKSIFNAVLIFNDRHVGCYFSHHELNLYSLKWEHGVLTTRLSGKSHFILLYDSVVTINQGWSQDELK